MWGSFLIYLLSFRTPSSNVLTLLTSHISLLQNRIYVVDTRYGRFLSMQEHDGRFGRPSDSEAWLGARFFIAHSRSCNTPTSTPRNVS
ncbi:hypothetical protein D9757_013087 [Collybiopsis confluens]|uniref:Uncharacterized protein n=1 Tax=Collybiopsis confluens TaxID=2823264 RepID=A0A8H5GHQ1_9AGAR|nr:hypothetical protein D9757_013087 [Collybiopsis confluens]